MPAIQPIRQNLRFAPLGEAERGARLIELRRTLVEKFPQGQTARTGIIPTGIQAIDAKEGGLRLGAMTEISGTPAPTSLLMAGLVSMLGKEKRLGALIDCKSFFDPGSYRPDGLKRLLWVRCANGAEGVKATDLLLRDGNLSLLVVDLQGADLRGVPANTWHRFQRLVEQSTMALAILSSRPVVEGASVKIAVQWKYDFEAIAERRGQLLARLGAQVASRRNIAAPVEIQLRTA